jgi:hypothetical protein
VSSAQLILATSIAKFVSTTDAECGGGSGLHDMLLCRRAIRDMLLRRRAPECCLCMLDTTTAAEGEPGFFLAKPGMNMHSAPHLKPWSPSASAPASSCGCSSSCGAMDLPSARGALFESMAGAADCEVT